MTAGGDAGFREISTETVFDGRLLEVEVRKLQAPSGERVVRETVRHPGSVAVLPYDAGDVILIRQLRSATGAELLEVPGGLRDAGGEDPEDTASRECEEEIGYSPGRLTLLAGYYPTPGYSNEYTHLFLAEDLTQVERRPAGVEEVAAEIVRLPLHEALQMAGNGQIAHATTLVALYAFAYRRQREG